MKLKKKLEYAYSLYHLTNKEKEENTIYVGKGIYEELIQKNGYNPIKEYKYDYLVDYNTGVGYKEVIGNLNDAMRIADDNAGFTQQHIDILDNEGEIVAHRNWNGIAYDNADVEEEDPIEFGSSGYYSDWVEF